MPNVEIRVEIRYSVSGLVMLAYSSGNIGVSVYKETQVQNMKTLGTPEFI